MLEYKEEWKRSLGESHRRRQSREALLTDFETKVELMQQAVKAFGFENMQQVRQRAVSLQGGRFAWF